MTPSGCPVVTAPVVYGDEGNDSLEIKMGVTNASVYGGNHYCHLHRRKRLHRSVFFRLQQLCSGQRGGNDTMYVGSSVFGGSSVYGGQGVDLISLVGTVTGSTVGGNLGTDTIELESCCQGCSYLRWRWFRIRHLPRTVLTASAWVQSSAQVL